ncbi:MAG: CRISPR-associated protein Cas4 [Firmicutes bacterium]|nr:CRISPR-associated protein Cas4 [Bacillota bacterium]
MEKAEEEHDFPIDQLAITGTMVAYYHICQRKLWLFCRGLNLENVSGNPDVIKGSIIHESRFPRETLRDVSFGQVKVDFIKFGDQVYLHELKKSRKFEDAHIMQMKYYIFVARSKGINCSGGIIHYPTAMRKVEVTFTEEDQEHIVEALGGISGVVKASVPPGKLKKKFCKRCAYFDFCYV